MSEFIKVFRNMSELAGNLLNIGTKLSLCVLIIGVFTYKYNEIFIGGYGNELFSIQIVSASWKMFVVFVLGAIGLDCSQKKK